MVAEGEGGGMRNGLINENRIIFHSDATFTFFPEYLHHSEK